MTGIQTLYGTDETNLLAREFAALPGQRVERFSETVRQSATTAEILMRSLSHHTDEIATTHRERTSHTLTAWAKAGEALGKAVAGGKAFDLYADYLRDTAERSILFLDTLRERGDRLLAHEAAGCPPVLAYDYEVVIDGRTLPRPCNYQLLRIVPPDGMAVHDFKRPYVIVDPRAGHGAGIGGFKADSQVGVALKDGHPVYFVGFRRDPVPGQTIADIAEAEGTFVREVMRRHPDAPHPAVTGNCQGGWGVLLTVAAHPDLCGPVVLNGSPVDAWSGEVGKYPMRYNAGLLGGTWQPMFWSDIGGGVFDGANLVMNFEMLNPSRNYFKKYYDLYARVDTERPRFLDFERWWGGYFLLNEPEIRWIVSELFVGNRLVKNRAELEPGWPVDLKRVQAPIIVFASLGDNITPQVLTHRIA